MTLSASSAAQGALLVEAILKRSSHSLGGRRFGPSLSFWSRRAAPLVHRRASSQAMAGNAESEAIVVYVTAPSKEQGADLASKIVTKKLAACVNQVPGIQSTYWWEGKVTTDPEVLLIIKTRKALLEELTTFVGHEHSYSVPEVIALPIQGGNPAYLKWLHESTKEPGA